MWPLVADHWPASSLILPLEVARVYMCVNVCMCIVLLWTVDICALGDGEILFVYRRRWWRDFGRVDLKWLFGLRRRRDDASAVHVCINFEKILLFRR